MLCSAGVFVSRKEENIKWNIKIYYSIIKWGIYFFPSLRFPAHFPQLHHEIQIVDFCLLLIAFGMCFTYKVSSCQQFKTFQFCFFAWAIHSSLCIWICFRFIFIISWVWKATIRTKNSTMLNINMYYISATDVEIEVCWSRESRKLRDPCIRIEWQIICREKYEWVRAICVWVKTPNV